MRVLLSSRTRRSQSYDSSHTDSGNNRQEGVERKSATDATAARPQDHALKVLHTYVRSTKQYHEPAAKANQRCRRLEQPLRLDANVVNGANGHGCHQSGDNDHQQHPFAATWFYCPLSVRERVPTTPRSALPLANTDQRSVCRYPLSLLRVAKGPSLNSQLQPGNGGDWGILDISMYGIVALGRTKTLKMPIQQRTLYYILHAKMQAMHALLYCIWWASGSLLRRHIYVCARPPESVLENGCTLTPCMSYVRELERSSTHLPADFIMIAGDLTPIWFHSVVHDTNSPAKGTPCAASLCMISTSARIIASCLPEQPRGLKTLTTSFCRMTGDIIGGLH